MTTFLSPVDAARVELGLRPLTAAMESTEHRRARVRLQLRDKHGKWIEMGGGVRWKLGDHYLHGHVLGLGTPSQDVPTVRVQDAKGVVYEVKHNQLETMKASLDAPLPGKTGFTKVKINPEASNRVLDYAHAVGAGGLHPGDIVHQTKDGPDGNVVSTGELYRVDSVEKVDHAGPYPRFYVRSTNVQSGKSYTNEVDDLQKYWKADATDARLTPSAAGEVFDPHHDDKKFDEVVNVDGTTNKLDKSVWDKPAEDSGKTGVEAVIAEKQKGITDSLGTDKNGNDFLVGGQVKYPKKGSGLVSGTIQSGSHGSPWMKIKRDNGLVDNVHKDNATVQKQYSHDGAGGTIKKGSPEWFADDPVLDAKNPEIKNPKIKSDWNESFYKNYPKQDSFKLHDGFTWDVGAGYYMPVAKKSPGKYQWDSAVLVDIRAEKNHFDANKPAAAAYGVFRHADGAENIVPLAVEKEPHRQFDPVRDVTTEVHSDPAHIPSAPGPGGGSDGAGASGPDGLATGPGNGHPSPEGGYGPLHATLAEQTALADYAALDDKVAPNPDGYRVINASLRAGENPHPHVEKIDAMMERSALPEDTVVTRYTSSSSKWLPGQLAKGDVVEDLGYMSTSRQDYINQPGPNADHAYFRISLPAGTHALDVSAQNLPESHPDHTFFHKNEQELLLPHGTRIRVISDGENAMGRRVIEAEYVLPNESTPADDASILRGKIVVLENKRLVAQQNHDSVPNTGWKGKALKDKHQGDISAIDAQIADLTEQLKAVDTPNYSIKPFASDPDPSDPGTLKGVEAFDKTGKRVGFLTWHTGSEFDKAPRGEIEMVKVNEEHQHKGVATALLDEARKIEPQIHHSDKKSESGAGWAAKNPIFTPEELKTAQDYGFSGYVKINKALRAGDASDPRVAVLDSLMQKSTLPNDMTLYRGLGGFEPEKFAPGDVFSDRAYQSTSQHEGVVENFTDDTIFEIHAPAGTHAIDMTKLFGYTGDANEGEFILPRDTQLRVTSDGFDSSRGIRVIKMEVIHDNASATNAPGAIAELPQEAPVEGVPGPDHVEEGGLPSHQSAEALATSPFTIVENRGASGDGYAAPGLWGKYGAAGVLMRNKDENGQEWFLLVQRGPMVSSNQGKWQLPGGAIDQLETPHQGVARETSEELGATPEFLSKMQPAGETVFEHPSGWKYTNIAADVPEKFTPNVDGTETSDAQWFTRADLAKMHSNGDLVPAFAGNLDNVLGHFDKNGTEHQDVVVDDPIAQHLGETVEALAPNPNEHKTGYTDEQLNQMGDAAATYLGIGHDAINDRLRGLSPAKPGALDDEKHFQEFLGHMDNWIDHNATPVTNEKLWRGLNSSAFDGLDVGDVIVDKGYLSTSSDKYVAEMFSGGSGGALMEITVPDGFRAVDVEKVVYSEDPQEDPEAEHLFGRGMGLRLDSITDEPGANGLKIVHATLVSPDELPNTPDASSAPEAVTEDHPTPHGLLPPNTDTTNWKKVGGQTGSNQGGMYEAPDGTRYYVKVGQSPSHARNEVLATLFYKEAGIPIPNVSEVQHQGQVSVASEMIPGAKADLYSHLHDQAYLDEVRKGFAVDAWLANWDVAGLVHDNMVTDENGTPFRVDTGGALVWRAQGQPKGSLFGTNVGELDTLRDPSMNTAGDLFGDMTNQQMRDSAERVRAITPERISEIVDSVGLDPNEANLIKTTLQARREDILKKLGVPSEPAPADTVVDDAYSDYDKELEGLTGEQLAIGKGVIRWQAGDPAFFEEWKKYEADPTSADGVDSPAGALFRAVRDQSTPTAKELVRVHTAREEPGAANDILDAAHGFDFSNAKPGDEVSMRASSWAGFYNQDYDADQNVVELRLAPGAKALALDPLGGMPEFNESIAPASKYRVTKVEKGANEFGRDIVHLEQVDSNILVDSPTLDKPQLTKPEFDKLDDWEIALLSDSPYSPSYNPAPTAPAPATINVPEEIATATTHEELVQAVDKVAASVGLSSDGKTKIEIGHKVTTNKGETGKVVKLTSNPNYVYVGMESGPQAGKVLSRSTKSLTITSLPATTQITPGKYKPSDGLPADWAHEQDLTYSSRYRGADGYQYRVMDTGEVAVYSPDGNFLTEVANAKEAQAVARNHKAYKASLETKPLHAGVPDTWTEKPGAISTAHSKTYVDEYGAEHTIYGDGTVFTKFPNGQSEAYDNVQQAINGSEYMHNNHPPASVTAPTGGEVTDQYGLNPAPYVPKGRTDQESYDYTDSPVDLTHLFGAKLLDDYQYALDHNQKYVTLKFDYEESVPLEAVRDSLVQQGLIDPPKAEPLPSGSEDLTGLTKFEASDTSDWFKDADGYRYRKILSTGKWGVFTPGGTPLGGNSDNLTLAEARAAKDAHKATGVTHQAPAPPGMQVADNGVHVPAEWIPDTSPGDGETSYFEDVHGNSYVVNKDGTASAYDPNSELLVGDTSPEHVKQIVDAATMKDLTGSKPPEQWSLTSETSNWLWYSDANKNSFRVNKKTGVIDGYDFKGKGIGSWDSTQEVKDALYGSDTSSVRVPNGWSFNSTSGGASFYKDIHGFEYRVSDTDQKTHIVDPSGVEHGPFNTPADAAQWTQEFLDNHEDFLHDANTGAPEIQVALGTGSDGNKLYKGSKVEYIKKGVSGKLKGTVTGKSPNNPKMIYISNSQTGGFHTTHSDNINLDPTQPQPHAPGAPTVSTPAPPPPTPTGPSWDGWTGKKLWIGTQITTGKGETGVIVGGTTNPDYVKVKITSGPQAGKTLNRHRKNLIAKGGVGYESAVSAPAKPTGPPADADPKWIGAPKPALPTDPPDISTPYVTNEWMDKAKAHYDTLLKGKPLDKSNTWPRFQRVSDDGSIADLKHLHQIGYLSDELYNDGLAQINAATAARADALAAHGVAMKQFYEDLKAWGYANNVALDGFNADTYVLKGMDSARDFDHVNGMAFSKKHWHHESTYPAAAKKAVHQYVGSSSWFNPALWKLGETSTISLDSISDPAERKRIKDLDAAMEFAERVPEDIILRRGTDQKEFVNPITGKQYGWSDDISAIAGSVQTNWAFGSASIGPSTYAGRPVQLKIRVPAGFKAIGIIGTGFAEHHSFESEMEVLLNRGYSLYIHKVHKTPHGEWRVDAEIVPPGWLPENHKAAAQSGLKY